MDRDGRSRRSKPSPPRAPLGEAAAMAEEDDDLVPSPPRRTPRDAPGSGSRYRTPTRPSSARTPRRGRVHRDGDGPPSRYLSGQLLTFCLAAVGFFALSSHAARQTDGAFERHFQELAKVKDDRRRLREEVEALRAENARLRGGEPANERT